jgi:hypothetical protein
MQFLGAGVAGIALEQAIPLGRVWSFPKEIVVPNGNRFLRITEVRDIIDEAYRKACRCDPAMIPTLLGALDPHQSLQHVRKIIDEWNRRPLYYRLAGAATLRASRSDPP